MTRTFRCLALAAVGAAVFASGSVMPAKAATNQAVLTVNATVTNNCDVLTQPSTLTMGYDAVQNVATSGTSSFTYACTNGASVSVLPTDPNFALSGHWQAYSNSPPAFLNYNLFNDLACATNQLTEGASE